MSGKEWVKDYSVEWIRSAVSCVCVIRNEKSLRSWPFSTLCLNVYAISLVAWTRSLLERLCYFPCLMDPFSTLCLNVYAISLVSWTRSLLERLCYFPCLMDPFSTLCLNVYAISLVSWTRSVHFAWTFMLFPLSHGPVQYTLLERLCYFPCLMDPFSTLCLNVYAISLVAWTRSVHFAWTFMLFPLSHGPVLCLNVYAISLVSWTRSVHFPWTFMLFPLSHGPVQYTLLERLCYFPCLMDPFSTLCLNVYAISLVSWTRSVHFVWTFMLFPLFHGPVLYTLLERLCYFPCLKDPFSTFCLNVYAISIVSWTRSVHFAWTFMLFPLSHGPVLYTLLERLCYFPCLMDPFCTLCLNVYAISLFSWTRSVHFAWTFMLFPLSHGPVQHTLLEHLCYFPCLMDPFSTLCLNVYAISLFSWTRSVHFAWTFMLFPLSRGPGI